MAIPGAAHVLAKVAKQQARKVYRDARGRFISRAKYELERRRLPSGRFGTKAQGSLRRRMESYLRAELGAPPAGKNWHQIASKYPERFENYLEGIQ